MSILNADLHCHSVVSDGTMTPEDLAARAAANGVALEFTDADLLDGPPPDVDVICAGDVFYEQPMAGRVLAWLTQAAGRGTRVLVGDPLRTYFPKEGFDLLAEYVVPTTRELEDDAVKRTRVWTLGAPC